MTVRLDVPPPSIRDRSGGGGGSGWVVLAVAANDIEAHLLQGRLRAAGIESRGITDRSVPGAWIYGGSNPWAPVTVFVLRPSLPDARIVMAEIAFAGPAADTDAPLVSRPRAAAVWWALALALGLLLTGLSLARSERALSERWADPCALQLICGGSQ